MTNKIVLIEKYELKPSFENKLKLFNRAKFPVTEVLNTYEGFEGKTTFYIEIENNLDVLDFINNCEDLLKNNKASQLYTLFYDGSPNAE